MTYHPRFRNRIIKAFCIFGFILSLTYWMLIDGTMALVEDMVFENRLKIELDNYLERRKDNPLTPLPYTAYIRGYVGREAMPPGFKKMTKGLEEGLYETDGPGAIKGPGGDFHLLVSNLPGLDQKVYLIYDVGALKVNEKYEGIVRIISFIISLMVAGIGAGIGVLIAGKAIAPLTDLTNQVARTGPDRLPVDLSRRFGDDEIGLLARTLEQSMQRIQEFIQREKAFTRDASHELRTPATVIRGAAELISQLPAYRDRSIQRPMRRIERAASGMALTIDTFLWLAREDKNHDTGQTCDAATQAREALVEHEYIFREKPIRTEFVEQGAPCIHAPAAVFRIVVNNLVRNAFTHTPEGQIRITVNDTAVEVYNTGTFEAAAHTAGKTDSGFGFGLEIVNRLCERYAWTLHITAASGGSDGFTGGPDGPGGTLVTLAFSK